MPRIRSIRPEFFSDPLMAELPFFQRLLYIGLWTFADDEGRGRAKSKELNGYLFPHDEDVETRQVEEALQELSRRGRILLYDVDGARYFQVRHWHEHQCPKNGSASRIPAPEGWTQDKFARTAPEKASLTQVETLPLPIEEDKGTITPMVREPVPATQDQELPPVSRLGIRNLESGGRNLESGGRRQEAGSGDGPSAPYVRSPDSALPALPFDASVFFSALPAEVQRAFPWHKWLDLQQGRGRWTLREIAWGVQILLERPRAPDDWAAVLHGHILPEVRAGKRPKCESAPSVRGSPADDKAAKEAAELAWYAECRRAAKEFEATIPPLPGGPNGTDSAGTERAPPASAPG